MRQIPYGHQYIDVDDIDEVIKVLKSDWITQGPMIERFEEALCQRVGAKYAVVVANGTAALHLACLAAGIKEKDEVITSAMSFVASANCILYCGGKPVFADINSDTANIDPAYIEKAVTNKTKAILPVHFTGLPCDISSIASIAKKNNLKIIEDASHALGAEYFVDGQRQKVGSSKHSDMTIFSFHPVKNITTAEGGAITTNDKELYEKLCALRAHGIYRSQSMREQYGPWYYEMRELGFNYKLTDIQCALGISQLKKLDQFLARRTEIVQMYQEAFGEDTDRIKCPFQSDHLKSAHHLFILRLNFSKLKMDKQKFFENLKDKGIHCQVHYIPIYWHPYYQQLGYVKGSCPVSEAFYEEAVSIPLFPSMSNEDVQYVIDTISQNVFKPV